MRMPFAGADGQSWPREQQTRSVQGRFVGTCEAWRTGTDPRRNVKPDSSCSVKEAFPHNGLA